MCVGNRSLWPFDDNQKPVSILVLLDVCREYKKLYDLAKDEIVSILVLLDVCREYAKAA